MELRAVIAALEALSRNELDIVIFSDSAYVVNAVEKGWLENWLKTGFRGKKNADLWQRYHQLAQKHKIRFIWVKGHADNRYNNRCDELATTAADGKNLQADKGYEEAS